jgi:hypothetical protein
VARRLVGLALAKLFEAKFPPIERAGVAQRTERERRGYGDIDHEELEDAFAGRRVKRKEPAREEPKAGPPAEPGYETILTWFAEGNKLTVSDEQPFAEYFRELSRVPSLAEVARRHAKVQRDEELAFWMELVLEGLHQALRLSREDLDSTITWQELMKFNVLRKV